MDYEKIAIIRAAQQNSMARQSWDYLNQSDPLYPEIVSFKDERHYSGRPISVSEARDKIRLSAPELVEPPAEGAK